jgi:hypothetical protein
MNLIHLRKAALTGAIVGAIFLVMAPGRPPKVINKLSTGDVAVATYHNDNLRTGWNANETQLNPTTVGGSRFGMTATVALDAQVDAEPLLIPNVEITAGLNAGLHNVVYVATEGNTIYAIDAVSGQLLLSPNFGPPVPRNALPHNCNENGPNVGINSTPVIDSAGNRMYVMVYTYQSNTQAYYLHELDLGSLTDVVSPVLVSASQTLTDGSKYDFQAAVQRQRPALLEANGNVYAAFGSFCDDAVNLSRGWLLGWQAGTLTPLAANKLTNRLATSPNNFFLSSIWMSGYGLSADANGNLYFVTGNSDPSGTTYDGVNNIQNSVIKISPDLRTVLSLFTPYNVATLDENDLDFGSGGVMLLPTQPMPNPNLAVAAGKDGTLFLMNQENLGGYTPPPGPNMVLDSKGAGGCWCGPSYFTGSDGAGRIASSGGSNIKVWKVKTGSSTSLRKESTSPGSLNDRTVDDPGFFTSVSSNGTAAGTGIIWAVSRPSTNNRNPNQVSLYAFTTEPPKGQTVLTRLFAAAAGTWMTPKGNSNIVPMVANGRVYVASYQQLAIFSLSDSNAPKAK